MDTRRPEPTDAELRVVWARCRRATWPATYEETMRDPVYSRLVRIQAMHPPRALQRAVAAAAPSPTSPQPPTRSTPGWRAPAQPALFDRKRAAAGDRDDD